MREIVREAAWYADVALDGRWAILHPEGVIWPDVPVQAGWVETDHDAIGLPPGGNLLYLRLGPDERLAGAGHQDDVAYEWDGIAWTARGPVIGINPLIYNAVGILVNGGTTPQGWRNVAEDGRLVSCDETIADPARRIWQYTDLPGGLTIGQGGEGEYGDDPMVALLDGHRYRLQDGRCRNIHAYRAGDEVALAWVQEDRREARIRWLTMAELVAYPEEPIPTPPIPPEPPQPKDGFYGVVCWGMQETLQTYQTLASTAHGFEAIRLNCIHLTDEALLYQAIRTVQLAGLRVIALIEPRQVVNGCPRAIDVEYLNEADIGCPPQVKLTPSQYAALVMTHYADAKAKGLRQWTGGISNISPTALAWLRAVLALLPADIGVAYHRYPPKWDASVLDPRPEWRTRAAEMAALKASAGGRPLICTEFGWDYRPHKTGWWIFGSWKSLSEVQVAQRTREEFAYLKAYGIQAACLYQINDPEAPKPPEHGCRASSGRWKPASIVR